MKPVDIGHRLVPSLLARDLRETLTFYKKLGFELSGCHPDRVSPRWAEVRRNGVVLQFYSEPPSGTPPEPVCSGTFYVFPESVLRLAEELRGKVSFAWGPEVMDYGMLELGIRDPNGYFVAFTEPA